MLLQSMAAGFHAWRVHAPYSREKRNMLSVALSAVTKRGQRAAWQAWHEMTGQRIRTRKLLQQALARMQGSLAARVSITCLYGMMVEI